MRNRLLWAALAWILSLGSAWGAEADALTRVRDKGSLRIAVYNDYPPYSQSGRGIDVAIGEALAGRLGVKAEIVSFNADEDMSDDLRNMVWKGHYLGGKIADVMMHVPVDPYLASSNDRVKIFGAYHREQIAVARNRLRIPSFGGIEALEVFTQEKVGVETATLADDVLTTALGGRIRDNVVHFKTVAQAVEAMLDGRVAAVMAPRGEIEGALAGRGNNIEIAPFETRARGMMVQGWKLGMAVKSDAPELADALEQALAVLKSDGTIERIFREHGVTYSGP